MKTKNKFLKLVNIDLEYFKISINNFKNQNLIHKNIEEFSKNIEEIFIKDFKVSYTNILFINSNNKKKYTKILNRLKNKDNILVKREIKFIEKHQKSSFDFTKELEDLGEICLPIYNSSRKIIALFSLGEKKNNEKYYREEIEFIESLRYYLGLILIGIVYQTELKNEVNKKTRDLQKLLKDQKDFIAVTSHELKTPATVVNLVLESLSGLNKNQFENSVLKNALNASKRLQQLIQNLFDIQSYDMDKIVLKQKKENINNFMQELKSEFLPLMKQKNINFEVNINIPQKSYYFIDRIRLRQVIINLLTNATKFTPENGQICMEVNKVENNFLFKIIDTGVGIPDDMKEKIFDKFQGNHVMHGIGLGLGLYICKKIIELHKGQIWVEDTFGGGATFCIKI